MPGCGRSSNRQGHRKRLPSLTEIQFEGLGYGLVFFVRFGLGQVAVSVPVHENQLSNPDLTALPVTILAAMVPSLLSRSVLFRRGGFLLVLTFRLRLSPTIRSTSSRPLSVCSPTARIPWMPPNLTKPWRSLESREPMPRTWSLFVFFSLLYSNLWTGGQVWWCYRLSGFLRDDGPQDVCCTFFLSIIAIFSSETVTVSFVFGFLRSDFLIFGVSFSIFASLIL